MPHVEIGHVDKIHSGGWEGGRGEGRVCLANTASLSASWGFTAFLKVRRLALIHARAWETLQGEVLCREMLLETQYIYIYIYIYSRAGNALRELLGITATLLVVTQVPNTCNLHLQQDNCLQPVPAPELLPVICTCTCNMT